MSQKPPRNIPASVRRRLLDLSKKQGEDFNYLLTWYAADRLLYRLSQSPYKQQFIAVIGEFVMPPSLAAAQGKVFNKLWIPATYWSDIQSIEEK